MRFTRLTGDRRRGDHHYLTGLGGDPLQHHQHQEQANYGSEATKDESHPSLSVSVHRFIATGRAAVRHKRPLWYCAEFDTGHGPERPPMRKSVGRTNRALMLGRNSVLNAAEQHIRLLNETWPTGNLHTLGDFYDDNAVLLPPDAGAPIAGQEAIARTYAEFANAATLNAFGITSLESFSFETGTAVHVRFDVDYSLQGERCLESGLELYWVDTRPRILWRHQTILMTRSR
ncbi:MAG: hypothetical protein QF515_09620 [Pseudomonadales bacterium]|nr:hypothetical protein [Pseudomonadales bacterium]MDP6827354.1 hypothetical protein [Pseudomonadales bacterium]